MASLPPAQQSWRILLALFCASSLIEVTAWGHMVAFTPLFLERELGMAADQVPFWTGLLAALPLCLAVPLAPFWGVLSDRYSRRLFIARSLVFEAIGYAVIAHSHSLLALVLVRLVLGLSFGNNALIVAALSLATPERRLGMAVGLLMAMFPIGLSVGPLLGSGLIALLGLRGMFAVDAALCLLTALGLALLVREPRAASSAPTPLLRDQLRQVFVTVARAPAIRWNFALWFLIGGGVAALDPFVPVLIAHLYQGPALATTIGLALAAFGLASGVVTPLTPRLASRAGEPRALAVATLALAAVAFALPLAPSVLALVALLLVRAAPQALTTTALYTHLVRQIPRERRSGVMALSPLPRNLAMLLVPLVASALSGYGLGAVFALSGALFLAALAATLRLQRDERGPALSPAVVSER